MKSSGDLRILLLSDVNSSHTQKWANELASEGHRVAVFSLTSPEHDWYSEKQIQIFNFKKLNGRALTSTSLFKINYLRSLFFLRTIVKKFTPDIVHAHYASSYGFLGALTGEKTFIVSAWGTDVYEFPNLNFLTRAILKYTFRRARFITATGKNLASRAQLFTKKKIYIVPFGIDTEKFSPAEAGKAGMQIVIGSVKALEEIYAPDVLVKAFALCRQKMPEKEIKLLLVGKGSQKKNLSELAEQLQISSNVELTGYVPPERIVSQYRRIDIFVNVSRFESFGVSVLEASSCSIPVVASDAGGLKEVGVQGETCLFVTPGNVEATAEAILTLIGHAEKRKEMGMKGRKFVKENYSIGSSVKKMLDVYYTALQQ